MIHVCVSWTNTLSVYSSDLAVIWWTHKLLPHSTWWGHWVRSAGWVKLRPVQSSPPGPRPCSDVGGREPEPGPDLGPWVQSWLPTGEMVAPRSWTCPNTGWTPPGWAARHGVRIQTSPEFAAARGTTSEKASRQVWGQERALEKWTAHQ